MSALTTHTSSNLREKKRKGMNKKILQQAIESQRKTRRKITSRRQVSDPLGKGNDSTHLRQNYTQAKSANHQTKARKPQRAPTAHMQAPPWTNAIPPGRVHADHFMKQSSCYSSALTGQTGRHHRSDRCATCERDQHSDRSDWCTTEPRNGLKPPKNLLNAFSSPEYAQTPPPPCS
jgi:hypothetical protein